MAKGLKEARRSARQQRTSAVNQGRGQRWVDAKPFDLADEVRYMQRRAAERTGRIVTIGPLLRFSTDSGDAWILDPADHLATQIAEEGAARPVHIEETETSFAVGWQGAYDIRGTAFFLRHLESGRVMTSLGYPTRHIVERISSSQAPPAWCHSKRGSGLRRQFGREQPFTLRNAGTEPVFSDFDVGNPRSGSV